MQDKKRSEKKNRSEKKESKKKTKKEKEKKKGLISNWRDSRLLKRRQKFFLGEYGKKDLQGQTKNFLKEKFFEWVKNV